MENKTQTTTTTLIAAILAQPRGVNRKFVQERPANLRAAHKGLDLVKRSTVWGRFVEYANQKSVGEAREEGRKETPNGWVSHKSDCPGLYTCKNDKLKVCFGHPSKEIKGSTEYFLNGQPVSTESVASLLLASETKKRSLKPGEKPVDWYSLNATNIVQIDDIKI